MIALKPISGKIDGRSFTILEGKEIPDKILKFLDIESLKKSGVIKEDSKPKKEKSDK